ncbi:hypothetical protein GHT06_021365 [Daphnia sinensis]|uniref:Histidine-rich glycoprotein-like n=1 Tax=Daphnia sinensis TaxID=1820382 RepID=A0AAD5PNL3_9CRUS|nr:hypothetical protein GHT06_021365 [Daphnia sinensis]
MTDGEAVHHTLLRVCGKRLLGNGGKRVRRRSNLKFRRHNLFADFPACFPDQPAIPRFHVRSSLIPFANNCSPEYYQVAMVSTVPHDGKKGESHHVGVSHVKETHGHAKKSHHKDHNKESHGHVKDSHHKDHKKESHGHVKESHHKDHKKESHGHAKESHHKNHNKESHHKDHDKAKNHKSKGNKAKAHKDH